MTIHTNPRRADAATARPVQIVAANLVAEHRAREARLITAALTAVCALAAGCAILPALDDLMTTAVVALIVAATAVGALRWATRRVRWWAEDRADTRTAAAWRAQHTHQGAQDCPTRAGVA
jgi:hypothetical protein